MGRTDVKSESKEESYDKEKQNWAATLWLALGMTITGVGQVIKMKTGAGGTDSITQLGYPVYILTLLGVWKILGVVTVLIPRFPLLKEWAYAGFFFLMTGALFSHFAVGHAAAEFFGPGLLLILTGVSWYFRPAERKVAFSESRKEKYEQCEDHKREVVA